jgi:hypothetical protein
LSHFDPSFLHLSLRHSSSIVNGMFHSAFQTPIKVSAHQPKSDLIYQIAGKETPSLIYKR